MAQNLMKGPKKRVKNLLILASGSGIEYELSKNTNKFCNIVSIIL